MSWRSNPPVCLLLGTSKEVINKIGRVLHVALQSAHALCAQELKLVQSVVSKDFVVHVFSDKAHKSQLKANYPGVCLVPSAVSKQISDPGLMILLCTLFL
jgi:hypothetical protein